MVVLILGGSGSGKSAYAEQFITDLSQNRKLYYLATMEIFDAEGQRKIERHRRMRAGKGFQTLEHPTDIVNAINEIEPASMVLLECMSNLVANEMFKGAEVPKREFIIEKIISEIKQLADRTETLVIVSNNVFDDGVQYDPSTKNYMEALGLINEKIALFADQVVEVIAGIPILQKRIKKHSSLDLQESSIKETDKKEKRMELYLGGTCQGKLNYVTKQYQEGTYVVAEGDNLPTNETELSEYFKQYSKELDQNHRMIVNHFHLWVRRCMEKGNESEKMVTWLTAHFPQVIIISDEIGNGIVPMDAFEREYREKVGRVQCQIAEQAERVERVLCGMGQQLK